MKVTLLTLGVVTFLTLVVIDPLFELTGLNNGKLAVGVLMMVLLGLAFGAIGFLAGALTGNKGIAGGVAGGLAFAMYLLNTTAQIVDSVHDYRWLSLFYYSELGKRGYRISNRVTFSFWRRFVDFVSSRPGWFSAGAISRANLVRLLWVGGRSDCRFLGR